MPPKKKASVTKAAVPITAMFSKKPKKDAAPSPAPAAACDENKKPSPERAATPTPTKPRVAELQEAPNSRSSPRLRTTARKDYSEALGSDDDDDEEEERVRRRIPNAPSRNPFPAQAPKKRPARAKKPAASSDDDDFVATGRASDDDASSDDDDDDDDDESSESDGIFETKKKAKKPAAKRAAPRKKKAVDPAMVVDSETIAAPVELSAEEKELKWPIKPVPPAFKPTAAPAADDDDEEASPSTSKKRKSKSSTGSAFDVMMKSAKTPSRKKKAGDDDEKFSADLDNDLPVISRPHDIFADIVRRFPEIGELAKSMDRPLRVATMCSGTEAPILAMDLTSQACEAQHGAPFPVEHIFSSEVEPFKQAYIQRNFAPPLLFRDVRELGNKRAHTAFGALEDVPQDRDHFDVLIAGTSCVDYSNLNDHKKTLDQGGESGQTFYGMHEWVQRARPTLVLLENVCGAPWGGMIKNFADIKYHARHSRLDTKHFYLPQTRTRGYLLAVAHERCGPGVLDAWEEKLAKMRRAASASLEAFMLAPDDPRVSAARADLKHVSRNKNDVPWEKCEARHARVRGEEKLGQKRPVTNWSHGTNNASLPDFAWRDWAHAQTERVLDSIDIDYMRLVQKKVDASFKTSVWDLSQNVDRSNPTNSKLGICPCLTPSLCAYVTNQGRPVIGVETLALQGIPIDDLLLTRESEDNLTSLSGNAMSTTVVGSALLAALLVLPMESLENMGLASETAAKKAKKGVEEAADEAAVAVKESAMAAPRALPMGALDDVASPLFEAGTPVTYGTLRHAGIRTMRRCICESRNSNSDARILRCEKSGHTACENCAGKPEHYFAPDDTPRSEPRAFEKALAKALPGCVVLAGVGRAALEKAVAGADGVDDSILEAWLDHVADLDGTELRQAGVARGDDWKATFADAAGKFTAELRVGDGSPEWLVYADAPPGKGALRDAFKTPVLRGSTSPEGGLLSAVTWSAHAPGGATSQIAISHGGDLIDTFESTFAMEDGSVGSKRHSVITVEGDASVAGTYDALPKCSAALGSLHKKRGGDVYFFLESEPVGKPENDGYVFALDWRKLKLSEQRASIVARLDVKWKPPVAQDGVNFKKAELSRSVDAVAPVWCALPGASLEAAAGRDGVVSKVEASLSGAVDLSTASPRDALAVLQCAVPVGDDLATLGGVWSPKAARDAWAPLAAAKLGACGVVATQTSREIGFVTPRLELPGALGAWSSAAHVEVFADALAKTGTCCAVCAPTPPTLEWAKEAGKRSTTFIAVEDPYSAGVYERALKHRPSTFAMQARLDSKGGKGELRVAVNARALCARAFASLPARVHARREGDTVLEWRVVPGEPTFQRERAPNRPFGLTSNRGDVEAAQPKSFVASGASLRPEQLRSLTWMLAMERGETFIEEEVVDDTLSALGWRAEARVRVPTTVRGGVLADAVGYGKTAITLALIDETKTDEPPALPAYHVAADGAPKAIPCKATLIVVPKHLMAQWPSELKKFLGGAAAKKYNVITIATMLDLKKLTVAKMLAADIVFVAVSAFRTDAFYDHLAEFAAVHKLPKKGGRHFQEVHAKAIANVERYVGLLQAEGPDALRKARKADKARDEVTIAVNTSKKQAYKDAAPLRGAREKTAAPKKKQAEKPDEPMPDAADDDEPMDEEDSESEEEDVKKPKKDAWKKLQAPPLQLFHFARKVVDEYTYLEARDVPTIHAIKARSSWVLSGTPPIDSFDDVKSIAAFLGVHLGAADPVQLTKKGTVARADAHKELSKSEMFHEFMENRSESWHARRRDLAQAFVNRFVRQNVAEIDEIPFVEHVRKVDLPSAERAVYLELEHHLRALEMQTSKHAGRGRAGSARSDREARLREALEGSGDAHEALLKRCAYSTLDGGAKGAPATVVGACDLVVARREAELDECASQIRREVAAAYRLEGELRRWDAARPMSGPTVKSKPCPDAFDKFDSATGMWYAEDVGGSAAGKKRKAGDRVCGHKHMRELADELAGGYGDAEASAKLLAIVDEAKKDAEKSPNCSLAKPAAADDSDDDASDDDSDAPKKKKKPKKKAKKKVDEKDRAKYIEDVSYHHKIDALVFPEPVVAGESEPKRAERAATLKELMWALRNQVYELRALNKEFVGRMRSLRFFRGIARAAKRKELKCDATGATLDLAKFALLSCCGHAGDVDALKLAAAREACPVPGCKAPVRLHSVVPCAAFAADDGATVAAPHGAKLAQIVDLVKSLPGDERVLVFVQFADLLAKVDGVLNASGIKTLKIKGSAHQMMNAMTAFQAETLAKDDPRVLLLELHNESASGANLTTANHAIFVHPLHVDKLQTYMACETQAIGRVRRYGQKRTVNLYRFLAADTVDSRLFETRRDEVADYVARAKKSKGA